MQYIKLQLGCLLVIAYIEITYVKVAIQSKIPCNRLFDGLLAIAPWAVFFDGLTAWTINHMDVVPDWLNRGAHLLFFLFMDLTIFVTAGYMYDQLIGFRKENRLQNILLALPGLISMVLIAAGIGQLEYRQGAYTFYSTGFSVYVGFASIALYYGAIAYLAITRRRFLSKDKVLGTMSFIVITGIILVTQIRFPEVLLTSTPQYCGLMSLEAMRISIGNSSFG